MANGVGCTCHAYSENECACDADWTDQETIDLRQKVAAQQARIAELREGITTMAVQWSSKDQYDMLYVNALLKPDDLSALEEAKQQAKREALMEAADAVELTSEETSCKRAAEKLRRMAGEVK